MTSISFYVPPPTPTPLPPNRPSPLRDSRRSELHQQNLIRCPLSEHLTHALIQLEHRLGLRCLTLLYDDDNDGDNDEDEDGVSMASYKLGMQTGQHLTLVLYTGPKASTHAHTYASLLSALHHLTSSTTDAQQQQQQQPRGRSGPPAFSPIRVLRPLHLLESTSPRTLSWSAVLVEDLAATLNLPTQHHQQRNSQTSIKAQQNGGNAIRTLASARAGTVDDLLTPHEHELLRAHLLQYFDDVSLPEQLHLSTQTLRLARLQVVQTAHGAGPGPGPGHGKEMMGKDRDGAQRLRAAGQRKDSAVGGLGYSPESAFRTSELRERSRATRTFDPSPERGTKERRDDEPEIGEILVDVELLCGASTRAIRLNQGGQKLYLDLNPAHVRQMSCTQLLSERP
ncbi:hypothetical protein OC835_002160 [Tilletia horrida]|nr:hypothetical protein OC835_002160 [Tilletia horrida]